MNMRVMALAAGKDVNILTTVGVIGPVHRTRGRRVSGASAEETFSVSTSTASRCRPPQQTFGVTPPPFKFDCVADAIRFISEHDQSAPVSGFLAGR